MTPACYNRPPLSKGHWRHGFDSDGRTLAVFVRNKFEDRCATWDGLGIGKTPETARYPQAHGWDCRGCRLMPTRLSTDDTKPGDKL